MDRFEMSDHDDLIDKLHEKVSEGNLEEAKRIAMAINSQSRKSKKRAPAFA